MGKFKAYPLAGVSEDVRFSKGGGRLKYNSGEFFFRDPNDTFYLPVHGADPQENSHFITLGAHSKELHRFRSTINAGVLNVGGNSTMNASYGNDGAIADPTMAYGGRVVALSISLTAARSAGTCTVQVKLNGVAQTGAGQVVQIDVINPQFAFAVLSSPIEYSAGSRIGFRTVTSGFNPTTSDATILGYFEEEVTP